MSPFPVVGLGASAGGLEAITELCAQFPARNGLALLVVFHLDPSRPSLLVDILAKRTRMTVSEAGDGTVVEIDHVYVIPPNASMTLSGGRLKVRPRSESQGPPMPIDDLLESLAAEAGANAIGVILSGSGTDGAIGMQAIRSGGGITFAQDDASAHFPSMPRAARAIDGVDFTLSPAAIARELLRIARHPENGDAGDDAAKQARAIDEDGMKRLFRRLRGACNVDFTHYKRGTIERRIARRQVLHDVNGFAAYLDVLEADPAEARALCRDLLIRYTEFFRDPDTFEALTATVFPRLFQHLDPAAALRVWVPGCSSGEEVYSIAICLMEYMSAKSLTNSIQIFGTDVSDDALETARAGRYIENIARTVSAERLNRFFVKEGEFFRISKALRDACTFARQNVAYDPPFSRIDFVSCRNLMIYLDPVLQKRVMAAVHFALQRDGVLMLGLSETVGAHSDLFGVIQSEHGKFFSKKPLTGRQPLPMIVPPLSPSRAPARVPVAADAAKVAAIETVDDEMVRITLARFAPASVLCDDEGNVQAFRGDTSAFLANPAGPPTSQLMRLARPAVTLALNDALRQARKQGVPVRKDGLHVEHAGQMCAASLEVVPLPPDRPEGRLFVVFFILHPAPAGDRERAADAPFGTMLRMALQGWIARRSSQPDAAGRREVDRLTAELAATRDHIRVILEDHESALEELKALEEETLSSNEEFQSTNEELETAKEELQSVNEELSTTNDELRYRNRELKGAYDDAGHARDYANALIETMTQPLLVLDKDLRVVRANRSFFDTFRTSARDTLHVSLYALGGGNWNIPALRALMEEILPRHSEVRDYEMTATFPQLGNRTMRLNASRVAWPDQSLTLLSIEDTTEIARVLAQLTTADRQKDEFLAMLAHELRNPLAIITNAVRLWKADNSSADVKRKAQAAIERQLRHQVRMIDDLLDVSRITRGVVVLRRERFDLVQTVRLVREGLQDEIAARGHKVTLTVPAEGLLIEGDAQRVEQVVTNLFTNAIKYTPANGRVDATLERVRHEAVLQVTDNGIGMTQQFLSEIFSVFVQADRSWDRNFGGLGVGLALARRLVELHDGHIEASSPGLGLGSRFVVRLPIGSSRRAASRPAVHAPVERPHAATPRKILVVDDNQDAAETTAALLQLAGHDVSIANDGTSALERAQAARPDAILLDIGMPEMDGFEACRRLRKLPQMRDVLIIAISGYGRDSDVSGAHDAGFDHHITKPFDLAEIEGYLRDL